MSTDLYLFVSAFTFCAVYGHQQFNMTSIDARYPKKYEVSEFITTYNNGVFNITGFQPTVSNPDGYPLHFFIQGTHSDPLSSWSLTAQQYATYMAERGFISVSIWYNNPSYPILCSGTANSFHGKAQLMFDVDDSQSALSVLCDHTPSLDIDCSKGIVGHGISQGAQLVLLAGNYAGDMIVGVNPLAGGPGVNGCVNYTNTAVDQSKIRSRIGMNDGSFCTGNDACRIAQTAMTGYNCAAPDVSCMQSDGSGWYIVQPDETESGQARHCYMFEGSDCVDAFDTNYYPQCASCDWSLEADLGWLIDRVTLS